MIQDTSRAAWDSIQTKLGAKQEAVLTIIRSNPNGITNAEIAGLLKWPINTVTPRCQELRKLGLVLDAGKRTCKATGSTAHVWKSAAPTMPPRIHTAATENPITIPMNDEAIEKLAAILWELIGQIDEVCPGLPKGWKQMMLNQLNDLEDLISNKHD